MIKTLNHLVNGESAVIHNIQGGQSVRRRLNHLGLHPQDPIQVVRNGYFGGTVLVKIHGIEVGIGQGMAEKIEVEVAT
jgi:Fe2+ transport system protein FeoA